MMTEEQVDLQEFTVQYYEEQLLKGMENFHPGGTDYTDRLASEVGIGQESRVLDVASGSGETVLYLALKHGAQVVGLDLSAKMIAHAEERAQQLELGDRVSFVKGNIIEDVPLEADSFDVAITECSLCLFRDKVKAVQNMARTVKPGGKIGISDVIRKGDIPSEFNTPLLYACCLAGAEPLEVYVDILSQAGLEDVRGYELTEEVTGTWRDEMPVLYDEVMNAFKDAIRLGMFEEKPESELDAMAEKLLSEKFGYAIISGVVP